MSFIFCFVNRISCFLYWLYLFWNLLSFVNIIFMQENNETAWHVCVQLSFKTCTLNKRYCTWARFRYNLMCMNQESKSLSFHSLTIEGSKLWQKNMYIHCHKNMTLLTRKKWSLFTLNARELKYVSFDIKRFREFSKPWVMYGTSAWNWIRIWFNMRHFSSYILELFDTIDSGTNNFFYAIIF